MIFESPAVAKGVVYAIDISGRVHALKAATGQVLWVSEQLALYLDFAAPTVANGVVYVGGVNIFSPNGIIFAIDAATGAKLWEYPLDLRWPPFYISPAVVNGMVYTPTCAFQVRELK